MVEEIVMLSHFLRNEGMFVSIRSTTLACKVFESMRNIMTVDEGIDIVASKQNIFYYLQVKTTNLTDRLTASVSIKRSNFDRGLSSQLRYFVVVRCGAGETRYFLFTEDNINMYSWQGYIHMTDDTIYIKIKLKKLNGLMDTTEVIQIMTMKLH